MLWPAHTARDHGPDGIPAGRPRQEPVVEREREDAAEERPAPVDRPVRGALGSSPLHEVADRRAVDLGDWPTTEVDLEVADAADRYARLAFNLARSST